MTSRILMIFAAILLFAAASGAAHAATVTGIADKCLDVHGGGSTDGTAVGLFPCHSGAKCLDVHGGGSADATAVVIWPCHGGPNQGWSIR